MSPRPRSNARRLVRELLVSTLLAWIVLQVLASLIGAVIFVVAIWQLRPR